MTLSNNFKLQVSEETWSALDELVDIARHFEKSGNIAASEPVSVAVAAKREYTPL